MVEPAREVKNTSIEVDGLEDVFATDYKLIDTVLTRCLLTWITVLLTVLSRVPDVPESRMHSL